MRLRKLDISNAGIKFIGITDPSGSGKSVAANNIIEGNSTESVVMPGDRYIVKLYLENSELSKRVFGRAFNTAQELFDFFYINESLDLLKKFDIAASPFADEMFANDISCLHNQTNIPNPIIGEWASLSSLDTWDFATDEVAIKASPKILSVNTKIREGKDKSLRYNNLSPWPYDNRKATVINNTGKLSTIKRNVERFSSSVIIEEPCKAY